LGLSEDIKNMLGEFVIIFTEEYSADGVGQDISVFYPLNLDDLVDTEQLAELQEHLGEAYHTILEFHVSGSETLLIYQRNL